MLMGLIFGNVLRLAADAILPWVGLYHIPQVILDISFFKPAGAMVDLKLSHLLP